MVSLMVWRGLVGMEGVLTMRSASALRFSKGCSSLNLDRMVTDLETRFLVLRFCLEEEGVQRLWLSFMKVAL